MLREIVEYKDIVFEFKEDTGKTFVYECLSKHQDRLGKVKWFSKWRRYAFYPSSNIIIDVECMTDIINFINLLMNDRKQNDNQP